MKLADVIDELRRKGLSNGGSLGKHAGIYDMAADLLEKHIPKKPDSIYREKVPDCEDVAIFGACPCCGYEVQSEMNYCSTCGQALEWEM